MKYNMNKWVEEILKADVKRPLPILSSPCVQRMDCTLSQMISDSSIQAAGMKLVADTVPSAAAVSIMDLSVEAEAFGSEIRQSDDEIPSVIGAIVTDEDEADALQIPKIGTARTGVFVDAIRIASELISDRPVFAGAIGPFSLAGRLMDVSEVMYQCYDEPETVHKVLEKATTFIIDFCEAFKKAGANGVILAEPLAGMLSPTLASEFSHPYVRRIIDSVQDSGFAVIYHNCGNNIPFMTEEIFKLGAVGYHFGDAVCLSELLPGAPENVLVMGNVSPSAQFLSGTPASVRADTLEIMSACAAYPGFVISSGCDIPPQAPWENIDAFFAAAEEFYTNS